MELTEYDQELIAAAREIHDLPAARPAAIREWTGDDDTGVAYAVAFGRASASIGDLLRLVDSITKDLEQVVAALELSIRASIACGVPENQVPRMRPRLRAVSLRRTRAPATAPQGPP